MREGRFLIIILICLSILTGCSDNKKTKIINNEDTENIKIDNADIERYIKNGDFSKVISLIPDDSKDIKLVEKKLILLYKTGKYDHALKLGLSVKEKTHSYTAIKTIAKIYFLRKNLTEFNKNLLLLPENEIDQDISNMLKTNKKYFVQEKEEKFKTLKENIEKAMNFYKEMDYIQTISILSRMLKTSNVIYDKENMTLLKDVYYFLGMSKKKMNNMDDSIYYLRKAVECDGVHIKALVELGDIYLMRGRFNIALEYYKQAYESSNDVNIYGNMGICYLNLRQYDKAEEALKEVYTKQPFNLNAMYNLFMTYYYIDDRTNMKFFGQQILQTAPVNSNIYKSVNVIFEERLIEGE